MAKALFIGLLITALLTPLAVAGTAEFYVTKTSLTELAPGETGVLNITLKNLGTEFASRISASLDPGDTSPVDPIGPVAIQIPAASEALPTSFFGAVTQGEEIVISYRVAAKTTASEGVYSVPLTLTWDVSGTTYSATLYIGMQIRKKDARLTISEVSPGAIAPGESAELKVRLKNTGEGSAERLTIEIDPSDTSPLDPIGPTKVEVDHPVAPGEEITLTYPVKVRSGTVEDVYYTPLSLSWETFNISKSATLQIGTLVKGEVKLGVASVSTDPSEIRSGDDNVKVSVSLENSGEATAHNVRAGLALGDGFAPSYSQSDSAYLGKLSSSESQSATFYVDVAEDLAPGKYSIPLELVYDDDDGREHSVEKSVDLLVEPKPYFRVSSVRLEPDELRPGGHALLYVEVENTGHEKAESVDLRVVRESGQPFDYDRRSDFIGTLKPGEKGTALLEFDVDGDAAPKEHLLKLMVRSTGDSELGDDNVYTQELKAPVVVAEGQAEAEQASPLPLALAAVAGLAIGFIAGRKQA
ncbi:MAG: hypothetical protein D6733_03980 [Methanobacteriota archaeon]|nr:MAG: hypothetical protein D6733_03980 [Euryarchaeota archaeon]